MLLTKCSRQMQYEVRMVLSGSHICCIKSLLKNFLEVRHVLLQLSGLNYVGDYFQQLAAAGISENWTFVVLMCCRIAEQFCINSGISVEISRKGNIYLRLTMDVRANLNIFQTEAVYPAIHRLDHLF